MKRNVDLPFGDLLTSFFRRYKFVLLVIAAGLVLLMLPTGSSREKTEAGQSVSVSGGDYSVEELEERLSTILSRIEGAGKTSVMLTVKSGTERILASDRESAENGDRLEQTEKTVVLSGDSGEEVVLIGENYPTFLGALVVCPGGGDPQIQLQITRALSALTGLGAGRITVCKGS